MTVPECQTRPYVPADLTFSRRVHVLFADGANRWVSDDVAAMDLEFFEDYLDD